MEPIYAETIHSFAKDLDVLWRDKNAFSSVKSPDVVSIEEGNYCSYKRFMLSTATGATSENKQPSDNRDWRSAAKQPMPLIERLAKTASIWTLPGLSRSQADKILHEFKPGIFLVRMNADQKTMVLSYRLDDRTQHVMIKVDAKKGFYMDGSQNLFRNVNQMIEYYMKHPIQNPDLYLKLPRALMEAHEAVHFQFFENMKINFWTTLLANKGVEDIWSKPSIEAKPPERNENTDSEMCPPLPPRGYQLNEFHMLQGLADISQINEEYQVVKKKDPNKPPPPPPKDGPIIERTKVEKPTEERLYSKIWQWESEENIGELAKRPLPPITKPLPDAKPTQRSLPLLPDDNDPKLCTYEIITNFKESSNPDICFTIPKIIEKYYPQLIYHDVQLSDDFNAYPSLTNELLHRSEPLFKNPERPPKDVIEKPQEVIYQVQYETPWDIKNNWISRYIDGENVAPVEEQNNGVSSLETNLHQDKSDAPPPFSSLQNSKFYSEDQKPIEGRRNSNDSLDSTDTEDDQGDFVGEENRLQTELLGEIETVIFSPSSSNQIYSQQSCQYGLSIRRFLTKLCSRRGQSEISKSVRLFITCTIARQDLSPYTTMRLIRQFMSGLKNLITKNKEDFSLNTVIKKEIQNTPKNVFINLDSIIESVLTKSVVKPLKVHVYKLLILEHYKNNNLKLIADGVESCKCISAEKLGLKENAKTIIDSKIESIRKKFQLISKQYSPEKKIKYMISIVEIVFNMLKLIYPGSDDESMKVAIKSESILPLFVYIFSQCKLDAVATQCEVEYIEGLIWSSKLVNGEPGFFLLNLMSALEAIKVLARPSLDAIEKIDLTDNNAVRVNNSSFFNKINPSSLSNAAIGSVNVIILDEKINRLVTKTFPVRSTVTVSSLCSTISYRLGIFNPTEYSLYKYTGYDESLLSDFDYPLIIKQTHQQRTGENLNFLFKRRNANFILPCDISVN